MRPIYIEGNRNGYSPEQCGRTLTVGELIEILESFDPERPVFLRNDRGYTYGSSARTACSTPRYSRFSTGMGPIGPASPERNAVAEHSYPHNSIPQAQPTNKPNKKGSEENASPQEP